MDITPIRHVLFDADDVLQLVPGGWYALMEPYAGDRARDVVHQAWKVERPTLAGEGDLLLLLAGVLAEHGVTAPVEQVFADVWCRVETAPQTFAVVDALRRNGYGIHLGTNQDRHRAAYLRDTLGYDDLFDVSCYSHDLGVAKPTRDSSSRRHGGSARTRRRSCSSTTGPRTSRAPARRAWRRCAGRSTTGSRRSSSCWPATAWTAARAPNASGSPPAAGPRRAPRRARTRWARAARCGCTAR